MSGFFVGSDGSFDRVFMTEHEIIDQFVGERLWSWGRNNAGQLGDNTTTSRSSPGTTAGGGTNWKQVSAGPSFSAAIKTDGTLWTWGNNGSGQLGDGTITARSSPGTTAGGGTNWKQVSCGNEHSAAIKTDGTLWTWGANSNGQLGDGTITARSSPGTTAGGGTNWKQVSTVLSTSTFTAAIKTDGTLWTWGNNGSGQLGDGTITARSSPGTTAGGGTNWKQVSTGTSITAAIKTDGTLWTWGNNGSGQLGDGTITNRSSPGTTAGGGILFFPPGTYILETTVILKSYVTLHGSGTQVTILKGKDSTTHVLAKTEGYDDLQGKNNAAGVGPYMFGIKHMSFNGNKFNRTSSSDGINIYGYGYEIYDIEVYYCKNIGFYSEWGQSPDVPVTTSGGGKSVDIDYMEATLKKMRVFKNDGSGIQFTGPHDSIMSDILCFINGNHGFYIYGTGYSNAGGTLIEQLHSYYNGTVTPTGDSIIIGDFISAGTLMGESNFGSSGAGIRITSNGRVIGGKLIAFKNQGPGVVISGGTQCNIEKIISYENGGSGVVVTSNDNSLGDIVTYGNNGDGLTTSGSDVYAISINSCRSFGNSLSGMTFKGGLWFVNNIYAYNNNINGVVLSNSFDRSLINGASIENSGVQFVMNTTGAGNIINMVTFSGTGQVNYTGTSTGSFTRITAGGTSTTPLNATP